jgi:hypothetical protein
MNFLNKLERNLAALTLVPLVSIETDERKRRTNKRLMLIEQKRKIEQKR